MERHLARRRLARLPRLAHWSCSRRRRQQFHHLGRLGANHCDLEPAVVEDAGDIAVRQLRVAHRGEQRARRQIARGEQPDAGHRGGNEHSMVCAGNRRRAPRHGTQDAAPAGHQRRQRFRHPFHFAFQRAACADGAPTSQGVRIGVHHAPAERVVFGLASGKHRHQAARRQGEQAHAGKPNHDETPIDDRERRKTAQHHGQASADAQHHRRVARQTWGKRCRPVQQVPIVEGAAPRQSHVEGTGNRPPHQAAAEDDAESSRCKRRGSAHHRPERQRHGQAPEAPIKPPFDCLVDSNGRESRHRQRGGNRQHIQHRLQGEPAPRPPAIRREERCHCPCSWRLVHRDLWKRSQLSS